MNSKFLKPNDLPEMGESFQIKNVEVVHQVDKYKSTPNNDVVVRRLYLTLDNPLSKNNDKIFTVNGTTNYERLRNNTGIDVMDDSRVSELIGKSLGLYAEEFKINNETKQAIKIRIVLSVRRNQ